MIVYWWLILLICLLIVVCLFRYTDLKPILAIGIGCLAYFVIIAFLPEVTVIKKNGDSFTNEKHYVVGSYKGVSTSFSGRYVINRTNEILVVYPSLYVDKYGNSKDSNKKLPDPIFLNPGQNTKIDETPVFFFKEPNEEMMIDDNILDNFLYWLRRVDKNVLWTVTTPQKFYETEVDPEQLQEIADELIDEYGAELAMPVEEYETEEPAPNV